MRRSLGLVALIGLAGCAHHQSATLLPGEPGHDVGALAVLNEDGSDKGVLSTATASSSLGGRFRARPLPGKTIGERYGALMDELPPPAEHFSLGFDLGQSTPDAAQEDILRRIFIAARARPGAEVQVVGHTDRVGSDEANDALSRDRAEQVRQYLISRGLAADLVRATWRGEREPLVATPDGVAEARNRRVEVIVR